MVWNCLHYIKCIKMEVFFSPNGGMMGTRFGYTVGFHATNNGISMICCGYEPQKGMDLPNCGFIMFYHCHFNHLFSCVFRAEFTSAMDFRYIPALRL